MERIQQKIDDFLNFGVRYIWVVNPRNRRAWTYSKSGSSEVADGVLRPENPTLEIPLAEIFAGLTGK
jgi:Uma2 family endonuclease